MQILRNALFGSLFFATASTAHAQAFPNKPLRLRRAPTWACCCR